MPFQRQLYAFSLTASSVIVMCTDIGCALLVVQSTLVIPNSKGLSEILRDIRTSTYRICRIEEKLIRLTTFNKYMCNWTLEVRDILKKLCFPQIFYMLLDFHV